MTQRMNGFRQKFSKLLHIQIWLSEQNIATNHTSLYQLIKIYQNIVLPIHTILKKLDVDVESVESHTYNSIHHTIIPLVSYKKHQLQIQTAIPHHVAKITSLACLLYISGIFSSNLHNLINIAISNIRHNNRMESDKNSKTWKYFNTDSRRNIMWYQASQWSI